MSKIDALLEMERGTKSPLGPPQHNGESKDPPRLADLLDETDHALRRHVEFPIMQLGMLLALWNAQTYCYERFRYCGYLALRSATPSCGKSQVLKLLSQLARSAPRITTIPTPAVLFRSTRPVLLLDEVDKLRNADKEKYGEVLAVLNCGFEAGAFIERCNKNTFKVEEFPVYGPKAFAGIEGLADTLAHRSFHIQMERSAERMPRFNLRKLDEYFAQLRSGFQSWVEAREEQIVETYGELPDQLDCLTGFDDRFQDISEPLVVLATLADAERPEGPAILPRLLAGLKATAERREPSGREKQLLAFLEIAEKKLGTDAEVFVRSADLVADCAVIEDLSFVETPKKLSSFLKHFDLSPKSNGTERGYNVSRHWVEEWRRRYGGRS